MSLLIGFKLPTRANEVQPVLTNVRIAELVNSACNKFGASAVRQAARQEINGQRPALENVGLGHYNFCHEHLLEISNMAFDEMTDKEKHQEFCQDYNIEFWWPL